MGSLSRRSPVWLPLVPLCLALGCDELQSPPSEQASANLAPAPSGSAFDPATAGTVSGRVTWKGALPEVPPFEARSYVPIGEQGQPRLIRANPNAPSIDSTTRGVA